LKSIVFVYERLSFNASATTITMNLNCRPITTEKNK